MLNDLSLIERGLTAQGVPLADRHPDITEMAKGLTLRVRLAADGSIDEVERTGETGNGAVWTLRDGKHNGFPGLTTGGGLLALDKPALAIHEQNWKADKTPAARRAELERLIAGGGPVNGDENWLSARYRKRIAERLEQLRPLADDPLAASVPAAAERFLLGFPSFLPNLTDILFEKLRTSDDGWLGIVQGYFTRRIPLVIDIAQDDFERDASDPRQIAAISAALSSPAGSGGPTGDRGICALTGREVVLHRGNFPQPNLPALGPSYIFTRNSDIPSLQRYDWNGSRSFPLAADLVPRFNAVFSVLTDPDARGRTWRLIPPETGDKPDLMIVSLPGAADEPAADMLAEEDSRDGPIDGTSCLFELGSRVIGHSYGMDAHGHTETGMSVLILRAVDPANRKAIYHRQTGAQAFLEAAKRWMTATANVPEGLHFPVPVKGERRAVERTPSYVTPLSITGLSRMQFVNGGRRRLSVTGTPAGDAFELFLGNGAVRLRSRNLLRLLLRRHAPLLGGLAAARSKGMDHLKDFDPKTDLRRDALKSITWIGVLLHHLGRSKEIYMASTAFRLGQLLAGADAIHIGYCADMRGGDVPPSLIGNAVLNIAGTRPQRALAILQSRLKPYLAWAKREEFLRERTLILKTKKTENESEKEKNVRLYWSIKIGESTASRLTGLVDDLLKDDLSTPPQDEFKAELLLGYLAGLPRLPQKKTDTANDDTEPKTETETETEENGEAAS